MLLGADPTVGRPESVRSMLVVAVANLADGFEGMMGIGRKAIVRNSVL
ncbi:hypothetical protein X749_16770 [Mesorhizobium sp. LNJC391B00]|nr:hypothetical protein X749_16770 [Mesorhizobium sp. LNJC391B00]